MVYIDKTASFKGGQKKNTNFKWVLEPAFCVHQVSADATYTFLKKNSTMTSLFNLFTATFIAYLFQSLVESEYIDCIDGTCSGSDVACVENNTCIISCQSEIAQHVC